MIAHRPSDPDQPSDDPGGWITDPQLIEARLCSVFGASTRLTASRSGYRLLHQRLTAGQIAIDTLSSSGFSAAVEPRPSLHAVTAVRGRLDRDSGDRIGPGQTMLSLPEHDYHFTWVGPEATVRAVVLDPALLADVAATDPAAASVRFPTARPITSTAEQTWRRTVEHFAGTVLADPESAASPLVVDGVGRLLAALVLTTFPNTAVATPSRVETGRHVPGATPATLRRAVDYIEAHADLDFGVLDVAAAAGVSGRAVQLAFHRHLNTTPMAYLRQVRLARAHAQLRAATPGDGTTVTAIAARWGFGSPSRFAAHYRGVYGVPPSCTLRS